MRDTLQQAQIAGLSSHWWAGYSAAMKNEKYDIDGLTADERAAREAGAVAWEMEQDDLHAQHRADAYDAAQE